MFIRFFRTSSLINLVMLPLVLMVMWVFILPKPELANTENAFPLFLYALRGLENMHGVQMVVSALIVVVQAFFLTTVINRHSVLRENSNLPALMYVVLMSCFPEQLSFSPLLFANFFIIIFLNNLFTFFHVDSATFPAFDAGLFIGLASLCYWPALFLFPLIYAGLFILRPFNGREWFSSLLGVLLPFLIFGTALYWFDMLSVASVNSILEPFYRVQFSTAINETYILLIVILALLILASLAKFFRDIGTFAKLKTRKYLILLVFFFVFAALSYLVASKRSMVGLSFLAIPLSVLFSNYFISLRNQILAELLFILLLGAVIYNQVLYFLQFNPL